MKTLLASDSGKNKHAPKGYVLEIPRTHKTLLNASQGQRYPPPKLSDSPGRIPTWPGAQSQHLIFGRYQPKWVCCKDTNKWRHCRPLVAIKTNMTRKSMVWRFQWHQKTLPNSSYGQRYPLQRLNDAPGKSPLDQVPKSNISYLADISRDEYIAKMRLHERYVRLWRR